jgi:glucosyl-3-phosphoglycerate synthase
VGTLAEVYRNCSRKRICQSDLCDNYEHKHQPLSPEDPARGLLKMSIDIGKVLFRTLASEGAVFSENFFRTLIACYLRMAQDTVKRYQDDAMINKLKFDYHSEVAAVEAFTRGIEIAGERSAGRPTNTQLEPCHFSHPRISRYAAEGGKGG